MTSCKLLLTFAVAVQASLGNTDVCADAEACGTSTETSTSGTALLHIGSSTSKVSWLESETSSQGVADAESSSLGEPIALTQAGLESQSQRLANLVYDSNDDDGIARDFDLEFVQNEELKDDSFHKYVEGKGYEEQRDAEFAPDVWNLSPEVKHSHNCYMYALNDLSPWSAQHCAQTRKLLQDGKLDKATKKDMPKICKRYFHKPGYFFQNYVSGRAETDVWFRDETTCKLMLPMLAADSPAIVWKNEKNTTLEETDACPENHYMASLVIAPRAGFHFYRRDHACYNDASKLCWSHKPGILNATDRDASGKVIYSVLKADRNYGELNYKEHCAFFCVPQNSHARTHSDSRKLASHK